MKETRHTSKPSRAEILKDFDSLPDSAMVRATVAAAWVGCSVPTVWNWVKSGKIPPPRKLSTGHSAWRVGDLRAALGSAA